MKSGRIAALAAGAVLAANLAGATTLQLPSADSAAGDIPAWDQPASAGPFDRVVPIPDFQKNGVAESAASASAFYNGAITSRALESSATGDTDAVKATGAPVPRPSLWTWMLAGFDRVGAALRQIATSS